MSQIIEVKVPDLGDFDSVELIEIAVNIGDTVELDQPLIVLESDKASMEIPSEAAGTVRQILVSIGDQLSQGDVIAKLELEGAGESPAAEPVMEAQPEAATAPAEIEETPAEVAVAPSEQAATPAAVSSTALITVPDIGDFDQVELIEIAVKEGEQVELDQTIVVLESDKASMEIPSEVAGTIDKILVFVGDKVGKGDVIAEVTVSVAAPAAETAVASAPVEQAAETVAASPVVEQAASPAPVASPAPLVSGEPSGDLHATPSVRKLARELGVDLSLLQKGSGRKSRILKDDVKGYVKQTMQAVATGEISSGAGIPEIPAVDFSKFGEIEEQPLNKIKQLTGEFLSRNWLNLPMVTHHDEADVTEMEAFRKSLQTEVKVTGLVFIMKALAGALKAFPQFNSSISPDGKTLYLKKYCNIGIAVDTPNGLVVPVIRDVDQKSLLQLSKELAEISVIAREGKLKPSDMQGGCMTISSLGGIGGKAFTPIVNAPEVAILGVTRSSMQPVWNGSEFVPRLMMPLDLTYDHRVIDGADGARFMRKIIDLLSDIRQQLL